MASFEPRGRSVRAVVRLPGGGKRTATFDTQPEARKWAATQEAHKAAGTAHSSALTVGQLCEAYLDAVGGLTDSAKWNKVRITKWQREDPIAGMRLCDIMTHDVNEWITRGLARGLSPATVNRETNLLSSVFNYAVKDRKWIPVNPCHGARRPERGTARNRPLLTPIEIEAVLVATGYRTDPELYTLTARVGACFLLSLETGMRSGEILRLRPSDYWRDKRTAHVAAIDAGGRKAARSGRASGDPGRNVPLTEHAMTVLDQLLLHMPDDQEPKPGFAHPPYIVGMNDGQRDALWRKARDRAGVADLHFHDTKHEAATRLARFLDVLALSHAIGTKNLRLLRDTYYANDATSTAMLLPKRLSSFHSA